MNLQVQDMSFVINIIKKNQMQIVRNNLNLLTIKQFIIFL